MTRRLALIVQASYTGFNIKMPECDLKSETTATFNSTLKEGIHYYGEKNS
jgi:hypothetical protein